MTTAKEEYPRAALFRAQTERYAAAYDRRCKVTASKWCEDNGIAETEGWAQRLTDEQRASLQAALKEVT